MINTVLYTYHAPYGQPMPAKARLHYAGRLVDAFYSLTIDQDAGRKAVHIARKDQDGNVVQRTWHENVDRAFDDADHEFGVRRDEWVPVHRYRAEASR